MPETTTFHENETQGSLQDAKDMVSDAAQRAKDRAAEFGRAAADKVEQQRSKAAGALHGASSTIREKADRWASEAGQMAHSAADRLDSAADYVREHDTRQMMSDVMEVVKKHPAQSLLVAAGLGFLMARAFQHDEG